MKKNVVLIGMPGSGKSTVGVLLAKALGMGFADLDLDIMQETGRKLQEILDEDGLDAFLEIESTTVLSTTYDNTVIATGGSVVLEPAAMSYLRQSGTVVFLDVPLTELKNRITNIKSRGIAFAPGQSLDDVYQERIALYRQYADVTIGIEKDIEATVESVWHRIAQSSLKK
jgi:shikimate kinase